MYERICKDCGKPFCGKCGLDDQYSHVSTEEMSRFECTRCGWRTGPMGFKAEPNRNSSCEACSSAYSAQAKALQESYSRFTGGKVLLKGNGTAIGNYPT